MAVTGTKVDEALDVVQKYLTDSYNAAPGRISSAQEARGVLDEEMEKLHDAIRANNTFQIKHETAQVAASALRILIDLHLV